MRHDAFRQWFFLTTVLVMTGMATWVMADLLWRGGFDVFDVLLLAVFVPLFGFVAFGFIQALAGFFILMLSRDRDPRSIARLLDGVNPDPAVLPPAALVFPIYNEDVSRVYEGIRAIYLDLARANALRGFDFFILSDSTDPNKGIEEEMSWVDLCKQLKGFGRIFYRRRAIPVNRKSGNVADFLRRWGRKYRYMVVLDADSLMTADTLVRLVALMEKNPQAGIIQSVPSPVQGRTFFARMLQFSATLYGPLFQAGQNYWQGATGNYWGHNAILRVAPFMEHCALPPLRGGQSRFMSHDYVEAALMKRAGYEAWMAYDLPGSYENLPPTLVDAARRDRRWCRGNLQHGWLLMARDLHPISRLHLFVGILSYWSSPMWMFFLLLGTGQFAAYEFGSGLPIAASGNRLVPFLDPGAAHLSLILFLVVLAMLTLPKVLAALLAIVRPARRRSFGGVLRICFSMMLEHVLSAIVAPILMVFHTRFVIEVLSGRTVAWNPQSRDAGDGVDWGGIVRAHWMHTAIGILWAFVALRIHPVFFWWLTPITFGLIASAPLSALLSWGGAGQALRMIGVFLTPSEVDRPRVVAHVERTLAFARRRIIDPPELLRAHYGFLQVVLDPYINAVHVSLLRQKRKLPHAVNSYLRQLMDTAIAKGPAALSRREQNALLRHAEAMTELHDRVWRTPELELARWWVLGMRHYNSLTARPPSALYR